MFDIFNRILDRINDGTFVGGIVATCLKAFAGIAALGGLVAVIATLKLAFNAAAPTSASLAGLVMAVLFVAAAAAVAQICLYRGARIGGLGNTDYPVMRIAAELCRLAGEVGATLFTVLGLATLVVGVVAGEMAGALAEVLPGPFHHAGASGFGAFIMLLAALALAFVFLVQWYLASELLQLCINVAADVRQVADGSGPLASGQAGSARALPFMSAPLRCTNCTAELIPGNAFCHVCGQAVAQAANA